MKSSGRPVVIVGGGLAGSLAAYALSRSRPEVPLLLLEQSNSFGGNHIWSFFDTDLTDPERALVEPFITCSWSDHEVAFPRRRRRLAIGYNSVRSEGFHRLISAALPDGAFRFGVSVNRLAGDHVVTSRGERIEASAVIDARGPAEGEGLELAWQKFIGRTYRFASGHGVPRPLIMDATVEQRDGYRFVYKLPFSETELLVEDTYYSTDPTLNRQSLGKGLDGIAGPGAEMMSEETGVLPILIAGDLAGLWPDGAREPVTRLGVAGGFFHPTTGYSLPDAAANALLLCQQRDFSAAALHRVFSARAAELWKKRHFFQLLNRMLFRAANPSERYRVLEHFYRLPEPVIARFYAAQLTTTDKLRILSGRPPVSILRALGAMRASA